MPEAVRREVAALAKLVFFAGGAASLGALALDAFGVNLLGFGTLDVPRNALFLTVLALCAALYVPEWRERRLGLVLFLPVFAQMYQAGLGWDVPVGPYSIARVLPYLACALAMAASLRRPLNLTHAERVALGVSAGVGLLGWLGSMDRSTTGPAFFLAVGGYLPLLYLYLRQELRSDPDAGSRVLAAGLGGFLTLALGTFALVRVGLDLGVGGGVEGLLGTRNISDFNLVLAYLLLLYPLALVAASAWGGFAVGALAALFFASSVVGLSRVGMVVVPLLSLAGVILLYRHHVRSALLAAVAFGAVCALGYLAMPAKESLGLVLAQRFNISQLQDAVELVERLRPGGEDSAARDALRAEAVRLFALDPGIGQGSGGYRALSVLGYGDAHSLTFSTLAEGGLVGILALYTLLGFLLLRLLRLATWRELQGPRGLFLLAFCAWMVAVHSVGGMLVNLPERGFNITALNAILLIVYLRADTLFAARAEVAP